MKLIRAVIQPHRLDAVRDALKLHGIAGVTVMQAQGFGRQKGHKEVYRGAEYEIHFLPKVVVEVVCPSEKAQEVCDVIVDTARTGNIGDGKIFVSDIIKAFRIRTGEVDEAAL